MLLWRTQWVQREVQATWGVNLSYRRRGKLFPRGARTTQRYWRRLNPSPARTNEYNMLELSGLGNQRTEDQLTDMVWAKDLSVVFLAETWTDEARLTRIQDRLKFKNKFVAPRRHKVGGLVIYWKEEFDLTIETFSKNHIDATIKKKNKTEEWRFTGFYGEPDTQLRHEAWARLRSLKNRSVAPWICAGNFNEVAKQAKKLGGRTRPHWQMQAFRDIIDECGFMDLGFVGSKFTWHKHFDNYTVWERLDRAMATNDWFSKFPNTKIYHLDMTTSDHKPLWIVPKGMECKQKWPFRFEQMWISESGCGETIEAVWQGSYADSVGRKILKKIETCGTELTKWSKNNFGNVRRELEKKRKLLTQAERVAINGGSVHTLKKLE